MVQITAPTYQLRMDDFDLNPYFSYAVAKLATTEDGAVFRYFDSLQDSVNNRTVVLGENLSASGGHLTGGTVFWIAAFKNGQAAFSMIGLNLLATVFDAIVSSNNAGALWAETLGGDDAITGSPFADVLLGFAGDDALLGDQGNDVLRGRSGKDGLFGGEGADFLDGGSGGDRLNGGLGSDGLKGGVGHDTFVFTDVLGPGNVDTISGFNPADDRIELLSSVFTGCGSVGSQLAAGRFVTGTAALDANDRILYAPGSGILRYDPDGSGPLAAIKFAQLDPGLAVTNADFFIVGDLLPL